eukprot:TRINITY_DN40063_c0_g1_i1.p1 TRINITY_DN40063_c0_g1~~TRINITY_DN40063_c0_g1_i1.p1  ORF type:complete len:202 (+),score=13.75 TRINITY_DN40063_c0_g1_i1:1-606(+)
MPNDYDPSLLRAWSAGFGSASCAVPELASRSRPQSARLPSKHGGQGQSYQDVVDLCDRAEALVQGHSRPATSHGARRCTPIVYSESSAFVNVIPGYTGHRPRVRKPYIKSVNALDMASQNARAYVKPAHLPVFKRHGQPKDSLTEFRKTCLAAIGKGSPYLKDPEAPGLKTVYTNVRPGEYFAEVQRYYGNRPTRGRFNAR